MSRITWGDLATRLFFAGVDRGVYFPPEKPALPWNGLISVIEDVDSDDVSMIYVDGAKIINRRRFGEFKATIEALTPPGKITGLFDRNFGFTYRIMLGDHYQIHLVYNANTRRAVPTYSTVSDNVNLSLVSFDLTTISQRFEHNGRAAHLIIDSAECPEGVLEQIEDIIYGGDASDPRLPDPDEIIAIFEEHVTLKVTDHGDGSVTFEGPDDVVFENADGSWTISWPSVISLGNHVYQISSL